MARIDYLVGSMTTGFFAAVPVGEYLVWAWLLVAAELIVLLLLGRDWRREPPVVAAVDAEELRALYLVRRIVPHLRWRQPVPVVEARQRWRLAAMARQQRRVAY